MKWLESEKILLGTYKLSDWKDVLKYTSDPAVWRYLDEEPLDEKAVRQFVANSVEQQTQRDGFAEHIPVVLRPSLEIIGHVTFYGMYKQGEIAGVSIMIGSKYQGRGYGTEALKNIIKYAFSNTKAHRLESGCDARNAAAVKMMEKAGLRREGVFRETMFVGDRWRDECLYSILKSEWKK
ncbi:MAG: GNAT family protein [Bacillota bacterium]|nr:GNAT family protein [Bacillota bacterium]